VGCGKCNLLSTGIKHTSSSNCSMQSRATVLQIVWTRWVPSLTFIKPQTYYSGNWIARVHTDPESLGIVMITRGKIPEDLIYFCEWLFWSPSLYREKDYCILCYLFLYQKSRYVISPVMLLDCVIVLNVTLGGVIVGKYDCDGLWQTEMMTWQN